jgi:ATPase family associated with various cellular activities (AAA)
MNEPIVNPETTLTGVVVPQDALPDYRTPLPEAEPELSLWDRFVPSDVSFFKLAMMDGLLHRPYHSVTLEGPIKSKQLAEEHRDKTFRSEVVIDRSGNQQIYRLLLRFDGDIFGYLENDTFKVYAPTPEAAQAVAKEFRKYVKPESAGKAFFYVISIGQNGPYTEIVTMERPAPTSTEDLSLHYGEDFPAWEEQWRERLRQSSSGLTVLHGPPGCGKTSYLRALMARLLDKAVFYFVPVSAADMLFDPRYLSFWVEESKIRRKKNKVVLLEDAEELLMPRDSGTRDKVSNLLNLADGFLGDHLRLNVICTTNALVRQLDPAILRPGRLLGSREFRRLTPQEAQRLAAAKGLKLADQPDYSLAEVYNGEPVSGEFNSERRVGFAQ